MRAGGGDFAYARVALPHTSAVWRRLSDGEQAYANRGHLHIGSSVLLPQPFSSPSCRVDRQTSGVPRPMKSTAVQHIAPRPGRASTHKNQTTKQPNFMSRSQPVTASPVARDGDGGSMLDLHYHLYGKSSYQSQFSRPKYTQHRTLRPNRHSMPALREDRTSVADEDDMWTTAPGAALPEHASTPASPLDRSSSGGSVTRYSLGDCDVTAGHDDEDDDDDDDDDDDESTLGVTGIPRQADNGKLHATRKTINRMFAAARFPPITAQPRAFTRSLSEENVRLTRTRPKQQATSITPTRTATTHAPFPRPYRQAPDGGRIEPPPKQAMLRNILGAHPTPKANTGRSLYRYDYRRHTIGGLRHTRRPTDQLAPRWN
ncbi:hypothetical protein PTSG_00751 [Salpingoeca rosetta]|uniref:Uncharacterized protein n=1 Tax=Salpingoeca rosetta (strain ATCC 50818 / BSB-021) TaxID=946362 RepID=F2TXD3_SALR5|nr:uncharacterized protein PTSG_00751 [Salpingoeca rosetta]EGD76042.1 hypothetical protein PTSG_00751 [Salpingoeca rosetta]|eukprot:XP_004998217.1 hypothetical protein PTSG_00751 [Salpingoeca rosetta]